MSDSGSKGRAIGFPLGAMVLIVLGIILLLNNFGYLPWGIWGTLWRFWPALLILIGVSIFFGRSRPTVALVITLVVILGVLAAAWVMASSGAGASAATSRFAVPVGSEAETEIDIDFAAGRLSIGSLPADSDQLAAGDISTGAASISIK